MSNVFRSASDSRNPTLDRNRQYDLNVKRTEVVFYFQPECRLSSRLSREPVLFIHSERSRYRFIIVSYIFAVIK